MKLYTLFTREGTVLLLILFIIKKQMQKNNPSKSRLVAHPLFLKAKIANGG